MGLVVWGCVAVMPATSPAPPPNPAVTAPVPDEVKAEATDLLGAAIWKQEEGQLGIATDLGRQSLAKWPDNPQAKQFLGTVVPLATAAQQAAPSYRHRRTVFRRVPLTYHRLACQHFSGSAF